MKNKIKAAVASSLVAGVFIYTLLTDKFMDLLLVLLIGGLISMVVVLVYDFVLNRLEK
jgi:hypothetical protein